MPIVYIRKAISDDFISQLAASMEGKVSQAFLKAVAAAKGSISEKALEEAIRKGSVNDVMAVLALDTNFIAALRGAGLPLGVISLRDAIQSTFAAAAKAAMKALPSSVSTEMSFNLLNPKSVQFLESYEFKLIQQITADTREGIRQTIINAFNEGGSPVEQAREIRNMIGLTGNQQRAVQNYRDALESGTTSDLRDALGRALRDGRYDRSLLSAIEDQSGIPQSRIDAMVARYQERFLSYRAQNIARTECLTGDALVDTAVVRAIRRRWYEGPIFEVTTSSGREFSTTPNHPMLTGCGWRFTNELQIGNYLVCDRGGKSSSFSRDHDVDNPPTTLSQIFSSLNLTGVPIREKGLLVDFHGDGGKSEVNALYTGRALSIGNFSPLYKSSVENVFSPTDLGRSSFCKFCARLLSIDKQICLCPGSQRNVSIFETSNDSAFIYSKLFGQLRQRFSGEIEFLNFLGGQIGSVVSWFEGRIFLEHVLSGLCHRPAFAGSLNDPGYPTVVSLQNSGNFSGAVSSKVELDCITSIRIRSFSGHVFNLETPYGYFTVNGIYTGNTIRASNSGQRDLWRQAQEQGLLKGAMRVWITADDDRTCDICDDLDEEEAGMDEEFAPGIMEPPDPHPSCRCSVALSFSK